MQDILYDSIIGLTWAGMERNIAIMIGSIPSLRSLVTPFVNLMSRTFSGSIFSTKKSQTGTYELESKRFKISSQGHFDLNRNGMKGRKAILGQNEAKYSQTTRSNISQKRILPV